MDIKDTLAQRQGTHGEFADNADIMQTLKDAVRARPGWGKLDATKREALDMILHKVGRIVTGNPEEPDHWHDIAGYATLARDRVKKPEMQTEPKKAWVNVLKDAQNYSSVRAEWVAGIKSICARHGIAPSPADLEPPTWLGEG